MTITIDILKAGDLVKAVNALGTAEDLNRENFLINNVFRNNSSVHLTENLRWGYDEEGIFLPGYSRRGEGAGAVEKPGQSLKTLTLPCIRKKVALDREFLTELNLLVDGYQGPFATDPNAQTASQMNARMLRLMAMINRQKEASAAQGLRTGTITVSYADGGSESVAFGYTGDGATDGDSHTIQKSLSGTAKWSSTGSHPLADIRKLRRQIGDYSHWGGACRLIAGYNVCDALAKNDETAKMLDLRRVEIGNLTITQQALFRGQLAGIPVFEYSASYDTSGGKTAQWDADTIALVADDPGSFTVEHAPVFDYANDNRQVAPELIRMQWFSKLVRHEDPPVVELIVESNPLPIIWNPNKVRIQKVC